ncbi:MAG: cupin domain-containing protein [Actinomycetota bacterium]
MSFPDRIESLPPFDGPFDAYRLAADGCEVLFASYPAGTTIDPHRHETENVGVITRGELILITGGEESRYQAGDWYHLGPGHEQAPPPQQRHRRPRPAGGLSHPSGCPGLPGDPAGLCVRAGCGWPDSGPSSGCCARSPTGSVNRCVAERPQSSLAAPGRGCETRIRDDAIGTGGRSTCAQDW